MQNRFYAWRDSGLWAQIVSVLVMDARKAEGREPAPTAAVVGSQSVKTTEAGGPRGGACPWAGQRPDPRDAARKVKGRKRHLAVDPLGLPIECQITAASVQDREALALLLKAVHRKIPQAKMSFAGAGNQGEGWRDQKPPASEIRVGHQEDAHGQEQVEP